MRTVEPVGRVLRFWVWCLCCLCNELVTAAELLNFKWESLTSPCVLAPGFKYCSRGWNRKDSLIHMHEADFIYRAEQSYLSNVNTCQAGGLGWNPDPGAVSMVILCKLHLCQDCTWDPDGRIKRCDNRMFLCSALWLELIN